MVGRDTRYAVGWGSLVAVDMDIPAEVVDDIGSRCHRVDYNTAHLAYLSMG